MSSKSSEPTLGQASGNDSDAPAHRSPTPINGKTTSPGLTAKESAAMQRRIRELDGDQNPASLAEQLARGRTPDSDRLQRIDSGDGQAVDGDYRKYKLLDLQRLQIDELRDVATQMQIS